jgi:hypothetical protein
MMCDDDACNRQAGRATGRATGRQAGRQARGHYSQVGGAGGMGGGGELGGLGGGFGGEGHAKALGGASQMYGSACLQPASSHPYFLSMLPAAVR